MEKLIGLSSIFHKYQFISIFYNAFFTKGCSVWGLKSILHKFKNGVLKEKNWFPNRISSSYREQSAYENAVQQQKKASKVDRLSDTLGLAKNNVKFDSDTNLYKDDKDSIIPAPVVASSSSENLDQKKSKKTKTKKSLKLSSSIMNKLKKLSLTKHMKEAIWVQLLLLIFSNFGVVDLNTCVHCRRPFPCNIQGNSQWVTNYHTLGTSI